MKFSRVVRAYGCLCQTRHSPGFDPSILRNLRVPDEAMLKIFKKKKFNNIPLYAFISCWKLEERKDAVGGMSPCMLDS
jgi:hypothetical protein